MHARVAALALFVTLSFGTTSRAFAQEPGEPKKPEETPSVTQPPPAPALPAPAQPPPPPPRAPERRQAPPPKDQGSESLAAAVDPSSPVVRAAEGDWGLFFRLIGPANFSATNNVRTVNGLSETQVGLKKVLSDDWVLPFYFGAGIRNISPQNRDSQGTWGADLGVGVEHHFRIWRRISPFIGGQVGFGGQDFSGMNHTDWGFGIGPVVGVEYYFADRVSLTAEYILTLTIDYQPNNLTAIALNTIAAGAFNLTFYF